MQKLLKLSILVCYLGTIPVVSEAYPGENCDDALFLVTTTSKDVRIYSDSVTHNYLSAHKKREKGKLNDAEEELKYAKINTERMNRSLAAYGGAIALADALKCEDERIEASTVCGFVNHGDGC